MDLHTIRKEYDKVYEEIVRLISEMGGEENIKLHRKAHSSQYRRLRELQHREHKLDALENRMVEGSHGTGLLTFCQQEKVSTIYF